MPSPVFSLKLMFGCALEIHPNICSLDLGIHPISWHGNYSSFLSGTFIPLSIMHSYLALTHLGSCLCIYRGKWTWKQRSFWNDPMECSQQFCPADFGLWGCWLDQEVGRRHDIVVQAPCTCAFDDWAIHLPFVCTFCKKMLCEWHVPKIPWDQDSVKD